jgi:DNA modification methylase
MRHRAIDRTMSHVSHRSLSYRCPLQAQTPGLSGASIEDITLQTAHINAGKAQVPSRTNRKKGASGIGAELRLRGRGVLHNVVQTPISSLAPAQRNPRKHSAQQIHRLAAGISAHGFLVPILIDPSGTVVLGHGRLQAARQLGLTTVPTITVAGMSAAQLRAFAIAENRLSDLATWDNDLLRQELIELIDLKIDIEDTAFSTGEVDILLDNAELRELDREDVPLPPPAPTPITRPGDLWHLNGHRLYCGDATEPESYRVLMRDAKADVVFTDPPYNVPVDGHVSGLGKVRHREFVMGAGEMSPAQFVRFLTTIFALLARHGRRGSIHYVCCSWHHLHEFLTAGYEAYSSLKNLCVWNKENAGMGSFYRSKHELVLVFQGGAGRFQNNVRLGADGRYRTNVWDYPGQNGFRAGRMDELAMHPTVKPLAMVADALRDCSKRGDLVLDPFVGSGTTILAAERTGRIAAAMEIDPAYADVCIQRWQAATQGPAVLEGDGRTFEQIRAARSSDHAASWQEVE